jgi:hypothetical protein
VPVGARSSKSANPDADAFALRFHCSVGPEACDPSALPGGAHVWGTCSAASAAFWTELDYPKKQWRESRSDLEGV